MPRRNTAIPPRAISDDRRAAMAAEQSLRFGSWARQATAIIDRKIDDAEAHALAALTKSLKETDDGRRTHLAARRGRSFQAGVSRLSELHDRLAGPSADSLSGLVLDARVAFYRLSLRLYWESLPASVTRPGITSPTEAALVRVRRTLLHGTTMRIELGTPIVAAKRNLLAAVNLSASKGSTKSAAADLIGTWARQSRDALRAATHRALNDSLTLADRMAGRDVLDPEILADDPTLPA